MAARRVCPLRQSASSRLRRHMTMPCNAQRGLAQISPAMSMRPVLDIPLAPMRPARSAVSTDIRNTAPSTYSAGVMESNQQTSGVEQGFVATASQGPAAPTAAQPIQQVPSAFTSRMEQQGTATPFAGGSDRAAAVQRNMMTSFDGIDAAGIAGSRDFIEGTAVSVQADSRDAFSSSYDAGAAVIHVHVRWDDGRSATFWRRLPYGRRHGRFGG